MRKLKLLMAACALMMGSINASAQASFNQDYKNGEVVAAGGDYFLYNIGAKMFLTDGMDWGTHATADHAGRLITFATLSEGKYSIYTASASVNNGAETKAGFMTTNGYLDSGSNDANWEFTPVSVDGYTNAYTIKNSDTQYLYFNSEDARVNVGESTNNDYSYWIIVPKTARESVKDYTFYLMNTDFNRPWERSVWTDLADKGNRAGGLATNRCAEVYHKTFDMSQTINASVANGRYKVYAQAFYRKDGGTDPAYLYANDNTTPLLIFNGNGEGTVDNMNGASASFNAGHYVNSVETFVSDGSLKVGIKNDNASNWVLFDNFYLEYLGQCVMDYAVALPEGGAMEAGTWYYFDIAAAADNYAATATTLGDIICTTDGYTLTSAATGNMTLTAEDNNLAATRYYVKSSSANQLEIGVSSYSYAMGTPTFSITDGSYAKTLTDFNVTFGDSQTNDPAGVLALLNNSAKAILTKGGSNIAEGTLSADGNVLKATFSNVTLDLSSTYKISIAAGVFGYEGQVANEAVSVSFNTPVIADGIYYFFNTDTKKYLSRGNTWGTQAITDDYGLPAYINFGTDGTTKVQFFDNNKYLSDGGWLYADNGTGGNFYVEAVSGGYKLKDKNTGKYVALYNGIAVGDAVEGDNLQGTSNIWALETPAQYQAKDNATLLADAQAATVAAAAGLTGITTLAALESELAANYGETSVTITGAKGEKYNQNASGGEGGALNENKYVEETVSDLKPGIYRLTVDAFQRAQSYNQRLLDAEGARSLIYVYAGSAKTQLKSVMEYGAETAYANDYAYDGKHYPNNLPSAYDALTTGNYSNSVYVYVADGGEGTGSLTFGINNPQNATNCGIWSVYQNFTLTYFEVKATAAEKTALSEAIATAEAKIIGFENGEYAPYNNIDAVSALSAAKAIDVDVASGAVVVEATNALNSAVWTANAAEVNAIYWTTYGAEAAKDASGRIFATGWDLEGVTDATNVRIMNDASANAGLAAVENNTAVFGKFDLTYGNTTGYTMPLKANKIYKLSFKFGGWNEPSNTTVKMIAPDESELIIDAAMIVKGGSQNGHNDASLWWEWTGYFAAPAAGNYVLKFKNNESGQHQKVIGNLSLVSASELEFADGTLPKYAPGTYPTVKITRSLTAGKWATAIYPFAVSGVDNIAVLDSYDGHALGFKSAAASEANVPFLMRSNNDKSEITLSNVEVAAAAATDAVKGDASMKGAYAATNITNAETNFVLSNNTIYAVGGASATINPYRAYIQLAQPTEARTLSFFVDGEDVTGIMNVNANQKINGRIFNLNGQRVDAAKKGLYILNGKKMVVK